MRATFILCGCFLIASLWACKGKEQSADNAAQPKDTTSTADPASRQGAAPVGSTDDSGPAGRMVTGSGTTDPDSIVVWIEKHDFEKLVGDGTRVQLLDVQTPKEFHRLHMGHAINVPFPADDFDTKIRVISKNAPVYVYCPSGIRSGDAAQHMKELGYKRIYVLQYGLRTWSKALYRTPPDMIPPEYR